MGDAGGPGPGGAPTSETSEETRIAGRARLLPFEDVNVHVPPRLVLLRALSPQDGELAGLGPPLEVLDRARIGGEHFQHLAPLHHVDLLLGLHNRDRALGPANVELSRLHEHSSVQHLRWLAATLAAP